MTELIRRRKMYQPSFVIISHMDLVYGGLRIMDLQALAEKLLNVQYTEQLRSSLPLRKVRHEASSE